MLDYEYINVLADILLDETCSEKERKLRFELVKKIQGRAQYYLERGFLPQVVEAFFAEKMEGISKVFTQKDAELFLKPSIPQVQYGDITTPNRPFYSEAEELMLWQYPLPEVLQWQH